MMWEKRFPVRYKDNFDNNLFARILTETYLYEQEQDNVVLNLFARTIASSRDFPSGPTGVVMMA